MNFLFYHYLSDLISWSSLSKRIAIIQLLRTSLKLSEDIFLAMPPLVTSINEFPVLPLSFRSDQLVVFIQTNRDNTTPSHIFETFRRHFLSYATLGHQHQ